MRSLPCSDAAPEGAVSWLVPVPHQELHRELAQGVERVGGLHGPAALAAPVGKAGGLRGGGVLGCWRWSCWRDCCVCKEQSGFVTAAAAVTAHAGQAQRLGCVVGMV